MLSIVAKGYRLRFTTPSLLRQTPWEIRSPQGLEEILLKRIPGKQSFRRVASSYRFKKSERSHLGTSLLYVHYKLSSEYRAKRRLHVQDRSTGCVLSGTNSSKQQEVPQICLRKQGSSVSGSPLRSELSPSGFHSYGAHGGRLPALSGYFGSALSRRLADPPSRPTSQAQLLRTLNLVGFILNEKKSKLNLVQDIQFLRIRLCLDLGVALLPESKAWEIATHGSFVPETVITLFLFIRPDRPVCTTASVRPVGPCQPTSAMAGPVYSNLWNPYLSRWILRFSLGGGAPTSGIPKFRVHGPLWTASSISVAWKSRR